MEFLALVPALVVVLLVVLQVLMLAAAWMSASGAARAGVRAAEVGGPSEEAAKAALPDGLAHDARVSSDDDSITVEVRVGTLLPGAGRFRVSAVGRR